MKRNDYLKSDTVQLKPECRFRTRLLKQTDIYHELDVFEARNRVFELPEITGFDTVKQHSLATVITELANNIVQHSLGGSIQLELVEYRLESDFLPRYHPLGLNVFAQDQGPGIACMAQACQEGFSTAKSLGCGLSGSIRLADQLLLATSPKGTLVEAYFWAANQHQIVPQLYIDQIAVISNQAPQFVAFSGGTLCSDLI